MRARTARARARPRASARRSWARWPRPRSRWTARLSRPAATSAPSAGAPSARPTPSAARRATRRAQASPSASTRAARLLPGRASRTTPARVPRPPTSAVRPRRWPATLEKIDYRDRAVTKVTSMVPPGRLRGRMAVQADALRRAGPGLRPGRGLVGQAPQAGRLDAADDRVRGGHVRVDERGHGAAGIARSGWCPPQGAHIDAKVASVHFGDNVHGVHAVRGPRARRAHLLPRRRLRGRSRARRWRSTRNSTCSTGPGLASCSSPATGSTSMAAEMDYAQRVHAAGEAQGRRGDLPELHRAHGLRGRRGAGDRLPRARPRRRSRRCAARRR